MLYINRRRVDWVDVDLKDSGTYTLRLRGRNDANDGYAIEVHGMSGDEPVIRLLKLCNEDGVHIATKMATLQMVLTYVRKFFTRGSPTVELGP